MSDRVIAKGCRLGGVLLAGAVMAAFGDLDLFLRSRPFADWWAS